MTIFAEDIQTYFADTSTPADLHPRETHVRQAARMLAFAIWEQTPTCPEQTAAILKVREAFALAQMGLRCHADKLPQVKGAA